MILEIRNLSSGYEQIEILKSVSIKVEEKQFVSIIGANGAGKSTLMRSIFGLLRVKSGQIIFKGRNITNLPIHQRKKLGLIHIPEGRRIFGPLTVYENLLMGSVNINERTEREKMIQYIWKLFPILQERKNQKGSTLSGGEQQMLSLARGLMGQPQLLVLDEPSLGLDPMRINVLSDVLEHIKKIAAILLVEQNARLALSLSERIYLIRNGEIVFEGTANQLRSISEFKELYFG